MNLVKRPLFNPDGDIDIRKRQMVVMVIRIYKFIRVRQKVIRLSLTTPATSAQLRYKLMVQIIGLLYFSNVRVKLIREFSFKQTNYMALVFTVMGQT